MNHLWSVADFATIAYLWLKAVSYPTGVLRMVQPSRAGFFPSSNVVHCQVKESNCTFLANGIAPQLHPVKVDVL